jgi:hypothetical protein
MCKNRSMHFTRYSPGRRQCNGTLARQPLHDIGILGAARQAPNVIENLLANDHREKHGPTVRAPGTIPRLGGRSQRSQRLLWSCELFTQRNANLSTIVVYSLVWPLGVGMLNWVLVYCQWDGHVFEVVWAFLFYCGFKERSILPMEIDI